MVRSIFLAYLSYVVMFFYNLTRSFLWPVSGSYMFHFITHIFFHPVTLSHSSNVSTPPQPVLPHHCNYVIYTQSQLTTYSNCPMWRQISQKTSTKMCAFLHFSPKSTLDAMLSYQNPSKNEVTVHVVNRGGSGCRVMMYLQHPWQQLRSMVNVSDSWRQSTESLMTSCSFDYCNCLSPTWMHTACDTDAWMPWNSGVVFVAARHFPSVGMYDVVLWVRKIFQKISYFSGKFPTNFSGKISIFFRFHICVVKCYTGT